MLLPKTAYKIIDSTLAINENEIIFDYPIGQYLEINLMLILLLEIPNDVNYNQNIFGYNLLRDELIWRIPEVQTTESHCPYTGMNCMDNQLRIFNWCDYFLIIDPNTGEILQKSISK